MTDPITPMEVQAKRWTLIPDKVIECFNELILKNSRENRIGTMITSRVLQKDVVKLIAERMGITDDEVYKSPWLDIEKTFEEVGWAVRSDKPVGWGGDDFDAYYEFEWSKY